MAVLLLLLFVQSLFGLFVPRPELEEFFVSNVSSSVPFSLPLNNEKVFVVWESPSENRVLCVVVDTQTFGSGQISKKISLGNNLFNHTSPRAIYLEGFLVMVVWKKVGDESSEIVGQRVDTNLLQKFGTEEILSKNSSNFDITSNSNHHVIVWEDSMVIRGQRLQISNETVSVLGEQFDINKDKYDVFPTVASIDDTFVCVWLSSNGSSIYHMWAQFFNETDLFSQIRISNISVDTKSKPKVDKLSSDFVVLWERENKIVGKRFNVDEIQEEFTVDESTLDGISSATIMDTNRYVVVWKKFNGSSYIISGQLFNQSSDDPIGSEFVVNTLWQYPDFPHVSTLKNGGFLVLFTLDELLYGKISQPSFVNNAITITEGKTVTLSNSNLFVRNSIVEDFYDYSFFITNSVHGQFEHVDNLGSSITSFPQEDVFNSKIVFVHDGSETSPSYFVHLKDEFGNSETSTDIPSVVFTNDVDDSPILLVNRLEIDEGEVKLVDTSNLNATDSDNPYDEIIFIINYLNGNGRFELVDEPLVPISVFNQSYLVNGKVQFRHFGSESPPSYEVKVKSGNLSTSFQLATIVFNNINDPPVFTNNQFTIHTGETVTLSLSMLSATDIESDDDNLVFKVEYFGHGYFLRSGNAISDFRQIIVEAGLITFTHDGTQYPPEYHMTVSDGTSKTYQNGTITFISTPTILTNQVDIKKKGESVVFTDSQLSATDYDDDDEMLIFLVQEISHGKFFVNELEATTFNQSQISESLVKFVHDGSEIPPSYSVACSDGVYQTAFLPAQVKFPKKKEKNDVTEIIGIVVGGSIAVIVVILCIIAIVVLLVVAFVLYKSGILKEEELMDAPLDVEDVEMKEGEKVEKEGEKKEENKKKKEKKKKGKGKKKRGKKKSKKREMEDIKEKFLKNVEENSETKEEEKQEAESDVTIHVSNLKLEKEETEEKKEEEKREEKREEEKKEELTEKEVNDMELEKQWIQKKKKLSMIMKKEKDD